MTLPSGTESGNRTVTGARPFTLEPDRAFLGCLMQLPPDVAHRLLAGVRPDDAHGAISQRVVFLVIRLVTRGVKPDPVVLLSEARNQGWLATEHRYEQFATWLIETYRAAPAPEAGPVVKRDMLECALRWAIIQRAKKVSDVAEHGEIDQVREHATLDTDRISDLWKRWTAAAEALTPAASVSAVSGHLSALPGGGIRTTGVAAGDSNPASGSGKTQGRAA